MEQLPSFLRRSRVYTPAALALLLIAAAGARAADLSLESVGARFGAGVGSSNNGFHQAEAFVDVNLPWRLDLGKKWTISPLLDAAAGWLGNNHENAAIGSLGPVIAIRREGFPLFLAGGSSPTFLSRSGFDTKDFGEFFQFTSHIGLFWDITAHWRLGYRFQHMSNASISQSNPGLNLHVAALSYRF